MYPRFIGQIKRNKIAVLGDAEKDSCRFGVSQVCNNLIAHFPHSKLVCRSGESSLAEGDINQAFRQAEFCICLGTDDMNIEKATRKLLLVGEQPEPIACLLPSSVLIDDLRGRSLYVDAIENSLYAMTAYLSLVGYSVILTESVRITLDEALHNSEMFFDSLTKGKDFSSWRAIDRRNVSVGLTWFTIENAVASNKPKNYLC
jgi:hypothetical protein